MKVIYDVGIRSAVCNEIVSNYFEYNFFCLDLVVTTDTFQCITVPDILIVYQKSRFLIVFVIELRVGHVRFMGGKDFNSSA